MKELTIEEIKKALDAGETVELECVDGGSLLRSGWHSSHININREMLKSKNLIATSIHRDGDSQFISINFDEFRLLAREIKSFRIKEKAKNESDITSHIHTGGASGTEATQTKDGSTFGDLIDVATQAWKDGYLKVLRFERGIVEQIFTVIGEDAIRLHDGDSDYNHAVDLIKSLYTETFVIKSEGDINLFKSQVESIVLANGKDIINDVMFHKNTPYFTNGGVSAVKVGFNVLKGATVTQKRGAL